MKNANFKRTLSVALALSLTVASLFAYKIPVAASEFEEETVEEVVEEVVEEAFEESSDESALEPIPEDAQEEERTEPEEVFEEEVVESEPEEVLEEPVLEETAEEASVIIEEEPEEVLEEEATEEVVEEPLCHEESFSSVGISISAPAGVFPAGTEVCITPVEIQNEVIEDAIDTETREVQAAYTFDISFLLQGEEIQPNTEYGTVSVTFSNISEAAEENAEVSVFHVSDELDSVSEEVCQVEVSGEDVAFEAEHFSVYSIVIFTTSSPYYSYEYPFVSGQAVLLTDILDGFGFDYSQYTHVTYLATPPLHPSFSFRYSAVEKAFSKSGSACTGTYGPIGTSTLTFASEKELLSKNRVCIGFFKNSTYAEYIQICGTIKEEENGGIYIGCGLYATYDEETKTITVTGTQNDEPEVATGPLKSFASAEHVVLDADMNSIPAKMFEGLEQLTDVSGRGWDSITSIGNYAFYYCPNLALTSLPNGVTSIADYAFRGCKNLALTSLPDGLTSIGSCAFYGCKNLALTSLPDGLTSIGSCAFDGCTNLALTSLPNGITSIGGSAFESCTNLALTSLPDGITSIESRAFAYCPNLSLTSLSDGITSIGYAAFKNCTNLALTSLPDGLTSIENEAFYNCTNLALTSLPDELVTIGDYAFDGCTNLALNSFSDKVTSIGKYAFRNCTSIDFTSLSSELTTIGDYAFYGCTNLALNSFPDKVTSIGICAFYKCENISFTSLSSGLTSIKDRTFYGCINLALTSLPSGVTNIEYGAFSDCTNLALSSLPEGLTSVGNNAFDDCVNMPLTSFPESLTTIGDGAFYNCKKIALTSLPEGITTIKYNTFQGCESLALTSLPSGLTTIGGFAFMNCTNLAITSLPDGLTTISDSAFMNCTNIQLDTLPDSITSIGYKAFESCTNLTITSLPDGLTTIGYNAFKNCTNIQLDTLSENITTIGSGAFYNCKGITKMTWNSSSKLDGSTFKGTNLTEITINNAPGIYRSAFEDTPLKKIRIGSSVTHIDDDIFYCFLTATMDVSVEEIVLDGVTLTEDCCLDIHRGGENGYNRGMYNADTKEKVGRLTAGETYSVTLVDSFPPSYKVTLPLEVELTPNQDRSEAVGEVPVQIVFDAVSDTAGVSLSAASFRLYPDGVEGEQYATALFGDEKASSKELSFTKNGGSSEGASVSVNGNTVTASASLKVVADISEISDKELSGSMTIDFSNFK